MNQCAATHTIRVTFGVFVPDHLGELIQSVPFEMVDAALVATKTVQQRVRKLPAPVRFSQRNGRCEVS